MRKLNILFLADIRHPANSLRDHINSYVEYSNHYWVALSPIGLSYCEDLDLQRFDAIALHYSVFINHERMLPIWLAKKIREFKGLKFQFIQDEYRRVRQVSDEMVNLGVHLIFTLVAEDSIDKAYNHPGLRNVRKISVLAGYVPEYLPQLEYVPLAKRPYDIIYRSREVPYWLGRLGQEKKWIAEGVLSRADQNNLLVDISVKEEKRIYGKKWIDFMRSGRCVLGTEGGASIWDCDGAVEKATNAYLSANPRASFDDVFNAVLAPYEGNMMYNTLSPRLFEAAALRTPMVLFPGWYNGVVEPDKHYIVLEKDFSNFSQVVDKIKDIPFLESLAERTYQDLIATGKYSKRHHVADVDKAIVETIASNHVLQTHIDRATIFNNAADVKGYVRSVTQYQYYLSYIESVLWYCRLTLRKIGEHWHQPGVSHEHRIRGIVSMLWKYIRIYASHYYARIYNLLRPIWIFRR